MGARSRNGYGRRMRHELVVRVLHHFHALLNSGETRLAGKQSNRAARAARSSGPPTRRTRCGAPTRKRPAEAGRSGSARTGRAHRLSSRWPQRSRTTAAARSGVSTRISRSNRSRRPRRAAGGGIGAVRGSDAVACHSGARRSREPGIHSHRKGNDARSAQFARVVVMDSGHAPLARSGMTGCSPGLSRKRVYARLQQAVAKQRGITKASPGFRSAQSALRLLSLDSAYGKYKTGLSLSMLRKVKWRLVISIPMRPVSIAAPPATLRNAAKG